MGNFGAPQPEMTTQEQRLIALLTEVLLDVPITSKTNLRHDDFALTDKQALELLHLLEKIINEDRFIRRTDFIRLMSTANDNDPKLDLKLLRVSGKRTIGMGVGMTSKKMRQWRIRLGTIPATEKTDPTPMTFTHFLKMEERLLSELRVHPRIAELILAAAASNEERCLALVRGVNSLANDTAQKSRFPGAGTVRRIFVAPLKNGATTFSQNQLVGLAGLITNTSVLFTTRDWGVAGQLSAVCANIAMISDRR